MKNGWRDEMEARLTERQRRRSQRPKPTDAHRAILSRVAHLRRVWSGPDALLDRISRTRHQEDINLVYVLRAGDFIKIGKSTHASLDYRVRTLQTGCPYRIFVFGVQICPSTEEGYLHGMLSALRIGGEWFVAPLEIDAFKQDFICSADEWESIVTQHCGAVVESLSPTN